MEHWKLCVEVHPIVLIHGQVTLRMNHGNLVRMSCEYLVMIDEVAGC